MGQTTYLDRAIPTISLANFESRINDITGELIDAAEHVGFFCIVDHGISVAEVDAMFEQSARFFSLDDSVKAKVPFSSQHNAGWEKNSQVRPSTGAADRKESYQMQFGENMSGRWIDEKDLPGFKDASLQFMRHAQQVSEQLMVCFARGLGFPDDYFVKVHDVSRPDSQTVARLLHYFETPKTANGEVWHRAGAHTDWDLLTLLFQKAGQSGLEICPGREVSTSFGYGDTWTKVNPDPNSNAIICNIGDLLMSWSDDRFKSTFHRVKAPSEPDDYWGERYSIACKLFPRPPGAGSHGPEYHDEILNPFYFNQPVRDCVIQGPNKKYPAITGAEFTKAAMNRNFAALQAKMKVAEDTKTTDGVPEGGKTVSVGA